MKPPGKGSGRQPRFSKELRVLYEDDAIVAVDKPAGLAAVPVKGSGQPSAWSVLSAELKLKRQRAFVVHRIDRFSSGVMLFAKTESDRDALVRQFLSHSPGRQYLAAVRGNPGAQGSWNNLPDRSLTVAAQNQKRSGEREPADLAAKERTLVHYLRREGMFQRLRTESDAAAARAELRYSVERVLQDASLVRVTLVTGLQNQIRVQFAAIGHPVIGDRKYNPAESSERRIDRVALHATHLEFIHPRAREIISIDSKLPPDFQALVRALSPAGRPRR